MIAYHAGDVTRPDLDGRVAIAHVLSDVGAYEAGVAAAIAQRHPRARTNYKAWRSQQQGAMQRPFKLGAIQWVGVGRDLGGAWSDRWVVNMIAQRGLRSATNPIPLDLDALRTCLAVLAAEHRDMVIAMPRIGCGLAGGSWDQVEPIVDATLTEVDVHVYDLNPPTSPALVH